MPYFVEGDDPETMHQLMAATLWRKPLKKFTGYKAMQEDNNDNTRPRWPMIILRSPKGWTGPKEVDGVANEGTFHSHQVPILVDAEHPDHVEQLESWMKSYKPEELFDENGKSDCRTG